MPVATTQPNNDVVRQLILDAARTRLVRFGYHKTTMAEIADDAGMSAANLYRYFNNKKDIVAECAARVMDERLTRLRRIADDRSVSASEKLVRYVIELVNDSHALAGTDSMIGELVDTITRDQPQLVLDKNANHCALLSGIIEHGVSAGEFQVDDAKASARYLQSAFALFDVPIFVGLYSREELEQRARGVVELFLVGLRSRSR